MQRLRKNLGTAGFVLAIMALVVGMTGAAFAAKKYVITSTSQIKPSVVKSLKGKAGATGATGATGAQGPAGKDGTNGSNGKDGTDGTDGTNGQSVVAGTEPGGVNCTEGGAKFEVEGSGTKTYACNGEEGSPWAAGGTLPETETETGAWAVSTDRATGAAFTAISFTLPLEEAPDAVMVKEGVTEVAGKCPGLTSNGTPTAEAGFLCVYVGGGINYAEPPGTGEEFFDPSKSLGGQGETAAPSGNAVAIKCTEGEGICFAYGTWAVTAP
jgi:hypothetical protein